jgi:hypothetical protein
MKLQIVRVRVLDAATAALLEAAVNTFLATISQREFVSAHYAVIAGPVYSAMITYTE